MIDFRTESHKEMEENMASGADSHAIALSLAPLIPGPSPSQWGLSVFPEISDLGASWGSSGDPAPWNSRLPPGRASETAGYSGQECLHEKPPAGHIRGVGTSG
ncbi:hypothetical protein P7K49_008779 [Saguinus oedipus]|uniref:Uncharacterized protein n=1 Tax=Saguinus oedipus TaxID=9490 RepID=A0ABQ9VYN5_SAGOE|nr:hypothetical protein P7K49_008779 [Saguinus oedipus]